MRIFAIRDQLIDYFLQPFVADNEKAVMATLSQHIHNKDSRDALAQAPHHFELWQLAIVQEDGHITAEKTLICGCSSLIRRDIRGGEETRPAAGTLERPEDRMHNALTGLGKTANADQRASQSPSQAETSPGAEIAPGSGRLD